MAIEREIRTEDGIVEVTPTLDASGAYADGDLMADSTEIPGALEGKTIGQGNAVLLSLTVLDKDDNGGAFHVVFLRSDTGFGALNAAPSIIDDAAEEILGYVSVAADDYIDLGGCQVATVEGLGLELVPSAGESLYFAVISDGNTDTYTANGLVFKFGFLRG